MSAKLTFLILKLIAMQSLTNRQTRIPGSTQDELTGRFQVADKRCPICQAELASSAILISHVHHEHCDDLKTEVNENDEIYEKFLTDNHEWMKAHLEEELIERLTARMTEFQEKKQNGNCDVDDGGSVTKNVIEKVEGLGNSFKLIFCTYIDHYGSSSKDIGWGCGYRNIQMLLSCLIRRSDYKQHLRKFWTENNTGDVAIPSITYLQLFIQKAWSEGFDLLGAQQLGHSLIGTRKWIGATEVVTLLSFLRIRCLLVDFHKPTGLNSTHPELFKWVKSHFQHALENGFVTPLILQHQGHSRTIIGIEEESNGVINLMILDPSWSKETMEKLEGCNDSCLRLLRVECSELNFQQYQIVAVNGTMLSDDEYENSKILKSIRIPSKL